MSCNTSSLNILNLNDYTLLDIFRYLNKTDLWLVSQTCQRLHDLVKTEYLWYEIDARDVSNNREKIDFCIEKITNSTKDIRMCADGRHIKIIPDYFFLNLSTLNLTVLALENQKICGNMLKLKDFPESLIELSFKKTYITDTSGIHSYCPVQLKNLKVLILDHCFWVSRRILSVLQWLSSLEILSLYKCKGLYDVDLDISTMQEFNALRIVDCRFSGLGDTFLKCLAKKPKIQEIYFQDYLTTYFLERDERELEIAHGCKNLKNSYVSDLDDIALWNEDILHSFVGPTATIEKAPYGYLSDSSIHLYSSAKPIQDSYSFQSILYQRPYNECTCQNNPNIVTRISSDKKTLTVSDEDMARKVCKGGYIYTLKPTDSSNVMGTSKSNSPNTLENQNHCEKDIAVMENTLRCVLLINSYSIKKVPEEQRKPRRGICGNAILYKRMFFGKYNDVSLKKLSLRGCYGVTDKALDYVKHLNLSLLDVTGTNVTAEGVRNFMLNNFDCRVIHESMCTCRPKMHF
ncbi:uncharacterized protein [Onthophagus taurus]|uniref:uncharacterized protein n=1 Tax=Onthophagus taurus TaxID=166361 RepID=UPI0039BDB3FA